MSAFGHGHEEDEDEDEDGHEEEEDEDSDVDSGNEFWWSDENGGSSYFEDFEEPGRDGEEHEDPRIITDEDEDGYQDLDIYEADNEDQDTDTDRDEDDHQNINPSEDQDGTSKLKPDKESSQESALDEGNLHSNTPILRNIPKPDPSPTPELHHETIALGQHHLWMI